ncbi:MAG: gliding motility-associated C-terminal domain-containing protein [Bacteroidales bacterium]|nr:gliding motility-associated C-terminal domain-containing protein [Bacteroidales bacterium]
MNCLKYIFSIVFITVLAGLAGVAQTQLTMKNVSVINEQGDVRLSWEYNGTEDLVIFRDSVAISSLSPIDTIYNPAITSYTDKSARANSNPRLYKIQSATTPNATYTKIISTYHLTFAYDSCAATIQLHWTDLEHDNLPSGQWHPAQFILHQYEDGILKQTTISNSNNSFTVNNIKENTPYRFSMGVRWDESPDSTGFSNPVSTYTRMSQSPDYIRAIYAKVEGNSTQLKFKIAPNSELTTYKLLKSSSPKGIYDTLKTITTSEFEVISTHENSSPNNQITYYRLVAINNCGKISTLSDKINNIQLTLVNEENVNSLSWNFFKEQSLPDTRYDVYRSKDNQEPQLLRSFSNHNTYKDQIDTYSQEMVYGLFCYFIRATEEGSNEYSQSNIVCSYLEPNLTIPEAITPNGDGKNDEFKIQPDLSFFPGDYQLIIYDRWLTPIFQSNDPGEAWNGKFPNGKAVPTGAYIYYLKIKMPDHQIIEKRGNITVFYP